MKEIKLISLHLENFMKFRDFAFEPNGKNAVLIGDNKTGKTTNASGFSWLLFDKDVHGNSTGNFSIKTTDENDEVIPNIDHSVTGILDIDGISLTLQKIYREKWLKKRKVLTGHTTEYLIDEVPVLKKEYDAKIAEIVPEETFRLLTDINYFNSEKFGWLKRRKILFQLCEGLSEEAMDVAEKAKKILASKKKKINEQKDEIRPRIDELHRGIVLVADYDQAGIKARIADLDKQIQTIKTDSSRFALLKEQGELEAKLSQLKADQAKEKQEAASGIRAEINKVEDDYAITQRIFRKTEFEIRILSETIEMAETGIDGLYEDWDRITKEEPDILDLCPTCKKPFLPEEKESVRAEFNLQQSKKKEEINVNGKMARAKKEKAVSEKINLEVDLKQKQGELTKIEGNLDKKKIELGMVKSGEIELDTEIGTEIVTIQNKIDKLTRTIELGDQEADTPSLEYALKIEMAKIAKIDAGEEHKIRIVELGEQEKALSAEIERLESDLFKAEENIQDQARLLEDEINNKFELVKFQLFETQMNEGVRPTCITLIDRIPYGHGLNKGNEINAGLDIIRTLSQHYGIQAPVFIDNCESISYPIDPECQCFKLIKVKDMEKLEITIKE